MLEFKDFWKEYPPRWRERQKVWVKSDRFGAETEWMKLTNDEKIAAMTAVGSVERSSFTPDARKWLKHKLWQDEVIAESSSPPAQQAVCICRKPARTYRISDKGVRIDLCGECDKAARAMGSFINRRISIADLERRIEQGKAEMQKRSTPKPKDPELVTADKQQAAIQKFKDNLGKG